MLPSEDGLGSGVWQTENGPGRERVALRMQEALLSHIPRAQKGQIAGPREQSQGGAKEGWPGDRWASAWWRRLVPGWCVCPAWWVGAGSREGWLLRPHDTQGHCARSGAAQPAPALPLVGGTLRANPFSPVESLCPISYLGTMLPAFLWGKAQTLEEQGLCGCSGDSTVCVCGGGHPVVSP